MAYSQKSLIELFLGGQVPNESGKPDHVETVISNVFLFPERVYKVYKNDNVFFNKHFRDIGNHAERLAFTKNDFEWNHQLSPELYLELLAVRVAHDHVEYLEDSGYADEFVCVTKRLPESASFFSVLNTGSLNNDDFASIGKQFALREAHAVSLDSPKGTFSENLATRCSDVENWISDGALKEWVSELEIRQWLGYFKDCSENLMKDEMQPLAICLDIHSLNAFYFEGVLIPFDTSPPKESWRFGPTPINVYRLAADIFAYAGEAAYSSFLEGYKSASHRPQLHPNEEKMWIVYASLIMVQYLFFLAQTDPGKLSAAKTYLAFLRKFCPV